MPTRPLRDDERDEIARIKASLYDWAWEDIKKAASHDVGLPRLAFLGLASWIDTVARLYGGNKGKPAWTKFLNAYLPPELRGEKTVKLLYDGFRCAMSHEYGTRGVALIDGQGELHWKATRNGKILNLENLIDLFDGIWAEFLDDLESDNPALRDRVLPRSKGLLAVVEVDVDDSANAANPFITSLSLSASDTRATLAHSITASPTGPALPK